MSVKKIIKKQFEIVSESVVSVKNIYNNPSCYLKSMLQKKYEHPTLTDEDWEDVKTESAFLDDICQTIDEAMEVLERLEVNIENVYKIKSLNRREWENHQI